MEDPYEILGISRDASPDEVKKAYRQKARENHPDLNPDDPAAEERMNKVNEAYDRITNPEKYAASDARRRASGYASPGYGRPGGSGGPGGGYDAGPYGWTTVDFVDLEDLFNGFAGTGGSGRPAGTAGGASDEDFRRRVQTYEQEGQRRGYTVRGFDPAWCCCSAMICPTFCANLPIICCL